MLHGALEAYYPIPGQVSIISAATIEAQIPRILLLPRSRSVTKCDLAVSRISCAMVITAI